MTKINTLIFCVLCTTVFAQNPSLSWAKNIGTSNKRVVVSSSCIDKFGNIYSTGFFQGTVDFNPSSPNNFHTAIGDDGFITKFSKNGDLVWAKSIAGNGDARNSSIAIDSIGNIYIAGINSGDVDFDPGSGIYTLTTPTYTTPDVFVVKLDSAGSFLWAKYAVEGNGNYNSVDKISIGDLGNIYLSGMFSDIADFDSGSNYYPQYSNGLTDCYILKLNTSGDFVWVRSINGPYFDYLNDMFVSKSGMIYLTGNYSGTISSVNNYTFTSSSGSYDFFVVAYDKNGNSIWSNSYGGTTSDFGNSITSDIYGNIYIGGETTSNVDLDLGAGVSNVYGGFVLKLDSYGIFNWAETVSQKTYDVQVDTLLNLYISGPLNGSFDFDPNPLITYSLTSSSITSASISKLDVNHNLLWAISYGNIYNLYSTDNTLEMIIDDSLNIIATSNFNTFSDFDPNSSTFNLTPYGINDMVINKMVQCSYNSVSVNSGEICSGESFTISPSGGPSYSVTGGSTIVAPLANTTYTVTSPFSAVCGNNFAICTVSVNPLPIIQFLPTNTLICIGETASVTVIGANSYTWSTGEFSNSITSSPLVETTYTVIGSDSNNCESSAIITLSVNVCTNLLDTTQSDETQFLIFPNPAINFINITNKNDDHFELNIVDLYGKMVYKSDFQNKYITLNISHLTNGIYFLNLKNNYGNLVYKIVKQ